MGEQVQLTRFSDQYANNLLPYLQRCLDLFCPAAALSKTLGISQLELSKLRAQDAISLTQPNAMLSELEDHHPAQVLDIGRDEGLKEESERVHFAVHENATESGP